MCLGLASLEVGQFSPINDFFHHLEQAQETKGCKTWEEFC